jgi:tetratricopeptide (TPR) repeat protein
MNLRPRLVTPTQPPIKRATPYVIQQCQIARHFEETGENQHAREALKEWWTRIGERPSLAGLDSYASAELLFHVGYLASRIGMRQRVDGAQEFARDMLGESISIFEDLQLPSRAAEARNFMAICYWREGRFETADLILQDALAQLGDLDEERRAILIKDRAILAESTDRHEDALRIIDDARALFRKIKSDSTLGKCHNAYGIGMKVRWLKTRSEEDFDRAVEAFTAATYHFQKARLSRELAMAENNLGNLLVTVRKFSEAGERLERARRIFCNLKEEVLTATVDDSRAKYFLAQSMNAEAEAIARDAVRVLTKASEKDVLIESLITHGRALARLNRLDEALNVFLYALQVTNDIESPKSKKGVIIACIEEMAVHACFNNLGEFEQLGRTFEHGLLERALMLSNGRISRAASLLGIKHGSLQHLLRTSHPDLLKLRKPEVKRRRSIISKILPAKKSTVVKINQTRAKLHLVAPQQTVDVLIDLPPDLPADGEYLAIKMNTCRLSDVGILEGQYAFVLLDAAEEGKLAAVERLSSDGTYSVGYLSREGNTIRLVAACRQCETLVFDKSEVVIEGRIVAGCEAFDIQHAREGEQPGFFLKASPLMK